MKHDIVPNTSRTCMHTRTAVDRAMIYVQQAGTYRSFFACFMLSYAPGHYKARHSVLRMHNVGCMCGRRYIWRLRLLLLQGKSASCACWASFTQSVRRLCPSQADRVRPNVATEAPISAQISPMRGRCRMLTLLEYKVTVTQPATA